MLSLSFKSACFHGPLPTPVSQGKPDTLLFCPDLWDPWAPCTPLSPHPASAGMEAPTDLLLGPAELLLHLLGKEAGSTASLALGHPVGSLGAPALASQAGALWFSGGCRGGSAVPSMPCIRPRGRGSDFPRQLPLQGWARSPAAAAGSSWGCPETGAASPAPSRGHPEAHREVHLGAVETSQR